MDNKLHEAFKYIKRVFFPRWDYNKQWVVKEEPCLFVMGVCNSKTKIIYLKHFYANNPDSICLLIHEICHAVTNKNHAKKWVTRMQKAAATSQRIGNKKLEENILKEIAWYSEPEDECLTTSDLVYKNLYDIALRNSGMSCEDCIHKVAVGFGMDDEDFKKSFKKYGDYYNKGKNKEKY